MYPHGVLPLILIPMPPLALLPVIVLLMQDLRDHRDMAMAVLGRPVGTVNDHIGQDKKVPDEGHGSPPLVI